MIEANTQLISQIPQNNHKAGWVDSGRCDKILTIYLNIAMPLLSLWHTTNCSCDTMQMTREELVKALTTYGEPLSQEELGSCMQGIALSL